MGLEVDLSECLVAYKGEVITCPECGRPYATFTADSYGPVYRDWSLSTPIAPSRGYCPDCGQVFGTTATDVPHIATSSGVDLLVKAQAGDSRLRLHLSSGWRTLGGE
jgi:hypothetical protein